MSLIDDLIAQHAPNGVRYVSLREVAAYSNTRVDAASLDETNFVGVDNLVSNRGGKVDATYLPNTERLTAFDVGDVLLGNIRPYLKKVWLATNSGGCSGDVLAIRIEPFAGPELTPEFLYYVLSSDDFFVYNMKNAKGAKMPRGNKDAILKYRIPVPPVEVQSEIVRALDELGRLMGALVPRIDAELGARRKQYVHWRDALLTFGDGVRREPLGEIAHVRTGQAAPEGVVADDGQYPFVNAGTSDSGRSRKFNTIGDAVTIPSRGQGAVGIARYQSGPFWCGPLCYRITSARDDLLPKYLYYYFKSIQEALRALQQTGGTPALNRKELVLVHVPVPPLDEQERIVAILDQFDGLVSELSLNLAAEQAARQQQYEYYRNRLLTFQERAA